MKQLIIITLMFGLGVSAYAGCRGCGTNHDHSKEKVSEKSCCSKDSQAGCKKDKSACSACPSSEKKSSCGSSK